MSRIITVHHKKGVISMDLIETRKSVRQYSNKTIPDDILKQILNAGRLAPSWMNSQPWQFIVVKSQETKDLLCKLSNNQPHVKMADTVIVCVADNNAWSKEVFGKVGIDMIAGPSEILILADNSANPDFLAADLLSQAEHDKLASAILVTDSEKIANDTAAALEKRLENLPRNEIASAAIQNNSKIILTKDMEEAICISDAIAPEHLELAVDNPFETLEKVHNAGSIFLGHFTPEPLGDYFAGPNHTLPTNGSAKFSSPLSVDDFVKKSSYIFYSEQNLKQVEKDVAAFARREGLDAHAQAVEARSLKNE